MRVRCCLALLLASSALAAAAAAAAPVTSGCTTDAAVLASIPEQSESAIAYPAAIPGPSTSRTLPDGTLIAGRVGSTTAAAAAAGVAPQKAAAAGSIGNNQCIKTSGTTNACRASPNGRFRLCMQADSNVVLYDNGRAYWASNTQGKSTSKPMRLCVQADNNVVAYDARNRVVWASNTCCNATRAPVTLFMQDDGNVVLYDKGCNPLWNTGTLRAPALAPPCRGGGRDRLPLAASATTGPFGGGDADGGGAFDDTGLDSQPITRIDVRAGSWIDALRVSYGGTPTPWRGGRGGGERPSLVLAADEFITRASVRAGGFVEEIRFTTNKGRTWSTSGDTSGDPGLLASPCPQGAYRLVALKGIGKDFFERVEFVWQAVPGAQGALRSSAEAWTCLSGLPYALRRASDGSNQPQCMSSDGQTCIEAADCWSLRQCADNFKSSASTCRRQDGSTDPTHWCTRARGALDLPSQPVPIRVLFLNVEVCDSGLAVDEGRLASTVFDGEFSLAAFWRSASFGRVRFGRDTSSIVQLRLPCDRFSTDQCDVSAWEGYLREQAPAVLANSGRSISDFDYFTFLAPAGLDSCQKAGIGFAAGRTAWIRGDFVGDPNIFKHELGHSISLSHSSKINAQGGRDEYGDLSTPMGNCERCAVYAAPHQLQLGWSRSAAVVDWAAVAPGAMTRIELPPLSAAPAAVAVVRLAAREPGAPGGAGGAELYLSYRRRGGQEASLPDASNRATSLHVVDGNTWLLGMLKDGQAWASAGGAGNRLLVAQTASSDGGASLLLCKFRSSPSECGSFAPFTPPTAQAGAAAAAAAGGDAAAASRD